MFHACTSTPEFAKVCQLLDLLLLWSLLTALLLLAAFKNLDFVFSVFKLLISTCIFPLWLHFVIGLSSMISWLRFWLFSFLIDINDINHANQSQYLKVEQIHHHYSLLSSVFQDWTILHRKQQEDARYYNCDVIHKQLVTQRVCLYGDINVTPLIVNKRRAYSCFDNRSKHATPLQCMICVEICCLKTKIYASTSLTFGNSLAKH